jgi:hypothetical protein
MQKAFKGGSVRNIVRAFELLRTHPDHSQDTHSQLAGHLDQTADGKPAELSADQSEAQPRRLLGDSLPELTRRYFKKKPMADWVICQELKYALAYSAPPHYQEQLLNLLRKQTAIMNALCIGINQLEARQHEIESEPLEKLQNTPEKPLGVFSTLSGFFADRLRILFQGIDDSSATETNFSTVAPTAGALNPNYTQEQVERITPTQEELRAYPQELLAIIKQFLCLTESSEYKHFLANVAKADYQYFTQLQDDAAHKKLDEWPNPRPSATLEHTQSQPTSREKINQLFREQLLNYQEFLPIVRREALNIEWKEMLRVILYNLLLLIRKEQSNSKIWQNYNPKKLLQHLDKAQIEAEAAQTILADYLHRPHSQYLVKTIPIEHPIDIEYEVQVYSSSKGLPRTIEDAEDRIDSMGNADDRIEHKIDEISRWIDRLARCEIAPFGNIRVPSGHTTASQITEIFSSTEAFVSWLKDPCVPLVYVRKADPEANAALKERMIIVNIRPNNINLVSDEYFYKLNKIINPDSPRLYRSLPPDDSERNSATDALDTARYTEYGRMSM